MNNHQKNRALAQFAILLALEVIVCFTPLGSLPIGPVVATLSHLPVILAAILLGTKSGMVMGFFFGLFSFLVMTFAPASPTAFVFTPFYSVGEISGNAWSLVICFVPRILIGLTTGLTYKAVTKAFPHKDWLRFGLSGLVGSATNTFLVLLGMGLFFARAIETVLGGAILALIGVTILTNGIPEIIVGMLVAYGVGKPLTRIMARDDNKQP
jgi:uncharacterized membrane protein